MINLEHTGVKGMKWGVRRNRNQPGGADGKPDAGETRNRKRVSLNDKLHSLKREREWQKVLRNMDELSTQDISKVAKRIGLENDLKSLSKSKIASAKDKRDYLHRDKMSDEELSRKVIRLRAKDNLHKKVKDASKEQREFGMKVVHIGSSLGIKYVLLKKSFEPKDLLDTLKKPKDSYSSAKGDLQKTILEKLQEGVKKAKV